VRRQLAVLILVVNAAAGFTAAASASDPVDPGLPGLFEVGVSVDAARSLPAAERSAALASAAESMERILKSGLPDDRRGPATFLSAEIHYGLGDFETAEEEYGKAEQKARKTPFADDAAAGRIFALEGMGKDEEAAKAWAEWEKKHADSMLLSEVRLARCWNALRRGALPEAGRLMTATAETFSWMKSDPRFVLAVATAAYLDGRVDDALALMQPSVTGPGATYLRALCHDAKGDVIKAAANFQEAAERYPESPLRDYALLAKANTFLNGGAYRSAAEEFARVVELASRPEVRAEAGLRHAASVYLSGDDATGADLLRAVVGERSGTGEAARAQFLLGELRFGEEDYETAILEYNRVLTEYFNHELAASAQYRVGQCLDAVGRSAEATSAYQAVVSGYPLAVEAPAAAYLAGTGLMDSNRYQTAVPYFQLVLDRYAVSNDSTGTLAFASPQHRELVEAALCLLELSYHRMGNLGELAGTPHLMLQKMPASESPWRAYALLIDADALAAQGRYEESQDMLGRLMNEFPRHASAIQANRLLAWTYARQGHDDLAIATEEKMLARYAAQGSVDDMSSAFLNKAHVLFNRKDYKDAAAAYEDFARRFPGGEKNLLALYQAGLCHQRMDHGGDAADRWETLVSLNPDAKISEKAWERLADLYFRAEHYDDAVRCYEGLLEHFAGAESAKMATLRLAQCAYNSGDDARALQEYGTVVERFPNTREADEAERGIEMSLYRLGQQEGGETVLGELVERFPTSSFAADAQFQLALRRYDAKEYAEAAEAFRRVVTQFPGYSDADRAYFLMGDAYVRSGDTADATTTFDQFMMFFPDSEFRSSVQFRLGTLRFEAQDYMRAAIDFTSVLESEATDEVASAALFNLALCQRQLGQDLQAKEMLQKYQERFAGDSRRGEVAYQLGDILDKEGEAKAAIRQFADALTTGPSPERESELHYRVGMCRETLEDIPGALSAYRGAMAGRNKSDPFRLSALVRAAALYEGQNNIDKALAAYRDLMQNAQDPELVAAAEERVTNLQGSTP
jgi:TolA-binding protein